MTKIINGNKDKPNIGYKTIMDKYEIFEINRQYDIISTSIKMDKSKRIDFNNHMPHECTLLKNVIELNNNELYDKIKDYFCLYYISALENTIENSFRKFWSLCERIIKDIHGRMKDEKLVKYMEKLLKMCQYPDKIIQRVKFIKTKRNNLVHENIHGEINQSDQAIVKIIAENLILFLICYFDEVTDIGDYKSFYNLQNQLIATINKTLQEISLQNNKSQKDIKPKAIQMNNDALYIYDYSTITKDYSFIDYIKAGVIIALSIGIDFTGSNGHPLDDGTLHSIKNGPNDYEKAITSCGYIVAYYDYDQLFPVYGFGAKIRDSLNDEVSMCFNLNFTNNPDIYTIGNIIKTYHEVIENDKLIFSGPTHFTPLIKEVISRIDKNNIFEYHILMILTDGVIDDLQDTIDILVEASTLPLSVIIIGIGNEDFTKMEILDGDEVPLKARNGKIRERDLVQFVPFSKFKNDEKILSMEVLAEIPRQMIEYYQFKNLDPDSLRNLKQQNRKIIKINPPQVRLYKVYLDNIKINVINQNNNQNKNIDNMTHRHYQNNQNHENNLVNPSFDPSAYTIDLNALPEFNTIYMPNQ